LETASLNGIKVDSMETCTNTPSSQSVLFP
jgi:hypothetical protein